MPESPVYKLRYKKTQRKRWEAAAKLAGRELSVWARDRLDLAADAALDNSSRSS